MRDLPYFKWYPADAGIPGAPKPPYGPYAIIDARATADEYFLLMTDAQLGRLMKSIGMALLSGDPPPTIPQRTDFKMIREFHYPGRTKRTGRAPIPQEIRRQVLRTGACLWCRTTEDLTVDHKVPFSRGGPTTIDNLQCLCRSCNSKKGIR